MPLKSMNTMYNINELQEEVVLARSRYQASDGSEWVKLVLALKTLSEAYCADASYDQARECDRESDTILEKVKSRTSLPFQVQGSADSVLAYFDEASLWARKAEESRKELENGGSTTKYAKTVNALCEYLCMSGQSKIALLKYEEALQILLSRTIDKKAEREQMYLIIVILLKASKCALDLGDESLSRSYSVYPFLYLAENADKDNLDSSAINWSYVAELCKSLMNK